MSNDKEPDIFAILMKFMFQVCVYIAATGVSVYLGTKVLRALGITP